MHTLRDNTQGEVFDYTYLMSCLAKYKSPRSKVTQLLLAGDIIRVKKGLYVFGQKHRHSVISLESIANQVLVPDVTYIGDSLFEQEIDD